MTEESHIEPSVLAQFADGTMPEAEASAIRDHITECRSCLAAYGDAVRFRAAWLADPQAFRLADEDRALLRPAEGGAVPARRASRRAAYRGLAIAAAFTAIVGGFMLARSRPSAPALDFRLAPATLAAIAGAANGGLVLPGAGEYAGGSIPERRSGPASASLRLEAELAAAIQAYEAGERSPEGAARVIAALLASGDVAAANDYAREAVRAHPQDVPLLVLGAVAKSRVNDLPEAERLLRTAIRRAPRDPIVALDLGLVLCRQGRGPESRAWLGRAAGSKAASVAARASRELARCEAPAGRE